LTRSLVIIKKEIEALQKKIGEAGTNPATGVTPSQNQENLGVNEPEAQLPERDPREQIQGPPAVSLTPTPAKAKTTPTPSENPNTNAPGQ
jgi:hypothetical protein